MPLLYAIVFLSSFLLMCVCTSIDPECESNMVAFVWLVGLLTAIGSCVKIFLLIW